MSAQVETGMNTLLTRMGTLEALSKGLHVDERGLLQGPRISRR